MTEAKIEEAILIFLFKSGLGFFWKNVSSGYFDGKRWRRHTSPFAINGTSDILGIVRGRFVAIEVKAEKGRVSDVQDAFLKKVRASGGVCGVARSPREALLIVKECFETYQEFHHVLSTSKYKNEIFEEIGLVDSPIDSIS